MAARSFVRSFVRGGPRRWTSLATVRKGGALTCPFAWCRRRRCWNERYRALCWRSATSRGGIAMESEYGQNISVAPAMQSCARTHTSRVCACRHLPAGEANCRHTATWGFKSKKRLDKCWERDAFVALSNETHFCCMNKIMKLISNNTDHCAVFP